MRLLAGMSSAAVLAVGVNAPAPARQDVLGDAVESLVAAGAPGAIGYTRVGDSRRYAAAGYADVVRQQPADARMRFRIASNTKAFTAAVVLRLAGERRLSLDAPVSRWLPRIPGDITVRELVVVMNVFDIAEDVAGRPAVPEGASLAPAVVGVFC